MEVNFLAKYANPTLVGMLYERVGDKLFLIIYPFSIYFIITEKYLNILVFDALIFFTLVLLRHKLVFLDFYFKMMKSHESIKDDFTVIENLVGKIDSYEIGEENKYRVILKNNQEVDIKFNNYNQFTLFSLDVD